MTAAQNARKNIIYLAKKNKNIKMKDLVKFCGVSNAFFYEKSSNNLNAFYLAAKYLGVSLDEICKRDMQKNSDTEKLQEQIDALQRELDKLKKDEAAQA